MDTKGRSPREIVVPISLFGSLRSELGKEAGTLPTVHAFHNAGFQAGTAAAEAWASNGSGAAADLTQDAFWSKLADFFGTRGWGALEFSARHPAVGILSSVNWAEAGPSDGDGDTDASCSFSTGFLSGLLSELAGGPIAVLEVDCRTRGQAACRFAFGSEVAIHELYGRMLDGADLEGALAAL